MKSWIGRLIFLGFGVFLGIGMGAKLSQTSARESQTGEQNRVTELEKRLISLQQQAKAMDLERNLCLAKFERDTILYDGILGDRKWLIHADIEPLTFGDRAVAAYSHYDRKTQTETVKFKAKHQ